MSMKTATVALIAGVSALALTGCSAGQISQTADQVAAVDGASANSEDGKIAVRDVTVVLDSNNNAALKFTAVNQDTKQVTHTLESVTVGGEEVSLSKSPIALEPSWSLVADSAAAIAEMNPAQNTRIAYVTTSLQNTGLAAGGNKDVVFTFDNATVNVKATVSAYTLPAGQEQRNVSQDVDTVQHGEGDSHAGHNH